MPLSLPAGLNEGQGGAVISVDDDSIAAELGLRPGDILLSLNGHRLRDAIDYRFYCATTDLSLEVERDGDVLTYAVQKDEDDLLGIDFENALFDEIRRCNNGCAFCFIGGLQRGMRKSLYIKDDDYRLSFIFGGFVTLTNLIEADWQRIDEQRLSPLYVSVHATEPELRRSLLANPKAPDILEQLARLGSMGIRVHCQVVHCPGVNDGEHLDRTISDLATMFPTVMSVAVVPVGTTEIGRERNLARLTRHGLAAYETLNCTPETARQTVAQISAWQRIFKKRFKTSFVHAHDEYYLQGTTPVPAASFYEGFPQFENGVGMTRVLLDEWSRGKGRWRRARGLGRQAPSFPATMTFACGTLIAPVMGQIVQEFSEMTGVQADLVVVENRYFGDGINCSGLLTASDLIGQLSSRTLGEVVVLPRAAVDDPGRRFLDDATPAEVALSLSREVWYPRLPHQLLSGHSPALARGRGVSLEDM